MPNYDPDLFDIEHSLYQSAKSINRNLNCAPCDLYDSCVYTGACINCILNRDFTCQEKDDLNDSKNKDETLLQIVRVRMLLEG